MSNPLIPDPNTTSRIEPREEVTKREPVTIEPRPDPKQDKAQSRGDGPSEHPN